MDLITTHLNADFDGLASMVAAGKLYPGAVLVLPGGAQESVRNFLTTHPLHIARLKDVALDQVRRLILVDVQEPERLGTLRDLKSRADVEVHIFDHHEVDDRPARAGSEWPSVTQRHVEPVGATITLLVEQLNAQQVTLTAAEATLLALGLYEETGSLAYPSTTPRDLEAAAVVLRAGADLNVVAEVLRHPLNPHLIALLNDLLQSGSIYYLEGRKILVATSTYDRYRGDLAEAAQRLAELQGFDAVIVAIALDEKVEVIGRSRRPEIDVAWIAREFGGGGHAVAAAASIKGRTLIEVQEQLTRLLTERYRPTLLARDVMTQPVKTIVADATVAETERALTTYGVNVLPVVDQKTRYVGTISREVVQKALFHHLGDERIEDLARHDQYSAEPETPFHDIETRMIELNQRFVPVLSGGKTVGVITRTDLLRTLHEDVLASARGKAKSLMDVESSGGVRRRDVGGLLRDRLPREVYDLLQAAGDLGERLGYSAYVVGGFVRDLLLGIDNLDVDFVVEGDGIAFARALAKERAGRVKVHERFGTAVVWLPNGFKLDVATARTEYYEYPTALPTVEQSSIKKDLYRRDFTINTLAVRLNPRAFGQLIDFYGGQRDLKERLIRVLHSLSFVEDPTRVFRAIRFELRFDFHLSKETLALIKGAAKMELFHRLSGQRVLDELRFLFSERTPRQAVRRLADLDLLRFIHPTLTWSNRLDRRLIDVEAAQDWYKLSSFERKLNGWLVCAMALAEVMPDQAVREMLERFPFTEAERGAITAARFFTQPVCRALSRRAPLRPSETVALLTGLADETLVFLLAKNGSASAKRNLSLYLTTYRNVKPTLTGKALQALGVKPGPLYRTILARLTEARLDGEVKTDAEERELVKELSDRTREVRRESPPHDAGR
ncbi:MAG: CBS domain-containing protein [Nitrospira sp.]|nr:CBS domain-containing protein [Nitrospira sp.]HQY56843.1 CBS domain-containing protein [Nitrospira sp.]